MPSGRITAVGGDESIRSKIIQVLFTTPGERVNLPDFGCGLFNLMFEPNNFILANTMEFTVGQALTRWLEDDIIVDGIDIEVEQETAHIEIVYTKRIDRSPQRVQIQFQ
jgi:phage baseplate assembly protein W